jgi:transcriptional regulator with XRE-family HTH domain
MGNSPSPTLMKLAAAIRRYRKRAGLTQLELAKAIPCSDKTISAIETGRDRPSKEMVVAIEKALDVSENALVDIFDLLDGESLPGWMRDWFIEERRATRLYTFQLAVMPGLLQTEDYARAVLDGDERGVQTRMERQVILTGDDPPILRCVIDESVLYRDIGGPKAMRDQLKKLVDSTSSLVSVNIARSNTLRGLPGAFTIATVDGGKVAYLDTAVRGIVTSSRDDISHLEDSWEAIRTQAFPTDMSMEIINRTVEERWT